MRWLFGLAALFGLVLWLGMGGASCYKFVAQDLIIEGDVTCWLDRAQVAASSDEMESYLDKTEAGLDKWDMHDGHSGLIIRNPRNDMYLIRDNLDRVQARAAELTAIYNEEGPSVTYQTGLDDLRGTLRELEVPAQEYYWRHEGLPVSLWMVLSWSVLWVAPLVPFLALLFWPSKGMAYYA